jgi:nucleoid DNA-binding protein
MNKKTFVEKLSVEMDTTKKAAENALDNVLKTIKNGLTSEGEVRFIGFGAFRKKKRKARKGTNPHTGKPIRIKASKTVTFKPGKALKEAM